jgi:hypothetical protein
MRILKQNKIKRRRRKKNEVFDPNLDLICANYDLKRNTRKEKNEVLKATSFIMELSSISSRKVLDLRSSSL